MTKTIYWKHFSLKNEKVLIYIFFSILFISYKSTAQNNFNLNSEPFYKTISFGEKIDFGTIDESVTWSIANSNKSIFKTIRGNEINDYVFAEPGEYEINYQENKKHEGECDHSVFADRFKIKVSDIKLSFDFSKISFSEKISKGKNYTNLIITVPVKINNTDNSIAKLPAPGLFIAGLGVSMTAEPMEKEVSLNNKTQLLKYKVSGIINEETYLMFDFYDFSNQVQTYNLPQIIK